LKNRRPRRPLRATRQRRLRQDAGRGGRKPAARSFCGPIQGLPGSHSRYSPRIARPPKVTFVARLRPGQAARGPIDNCETLPHWWFAPLRAASGGVAPCL